MAVTADNSSWLTAIEIKTFFSSSHMSKEGSKGKRYVWWPGKYIFDILWHEHSVVMDRFVRADFNLTNTCRRYSKLSC
jgi:hypothetical protein